MWAFGQFLVALLFEWLRFCVLRFSGVRNNIDTVPTLIFLYGVLSVILMIVSFVLLSFVERDFYVFCGFIFLYAVCQGVFDGALAAARANGRDYLFASGCIFRGVLALFLALALAFFYGEGWAALLGMSLAYLVALIFLGRVDFNIVFSVFRWGPDTVRFFFKYGAFLAAASAVTALSVALIKVFSLNYVAPERSGGALLSLDMAQKGVAVVGLMVNTLILQRAIKGFDGVETEEKRAIVSRQIEIAVVFLVPAAMGFYFIQPYFCEFIVPGDYQFSYMWSVGFSSIYAVLFSFQAYAIIPTYVLFADSKGAVVGPLIGLVSLPIIFFASLAMSLDYLAIGLSAIGSALVSIVVSMVQTAGKFGVRWPFGLFSRLAFICVIFVVIYEKFIFDASAVLVLSYCCVFSAIYFALFFWRDLGRNF